MGLSKGNISFISVSTAVISFVLLIGYSLLVEFQKINYGTHPTSNFVANLFVIAYIISVYIFFKNNLSRKEGINIPDLLWKVFVTGLISTILAIALLTVLYMLENNQLGSSPYVVTFFYHFTSGMSFIFLMSTFVVWKKLILYQKSRLLIRVWRIFKYSLLVGLLLSMINFNGFSTILYLLLAYFMVLAFYLSSNLKWVAYLNYRQKWKSMLLMLLTILYLFYFLRFNYNFHNKYDLFLDHFENVSIISIYLFAIVYGVFSILVLLFNLPISSVFEQKLEEVISFQRLSQSRTTGYNVENVYQILLESAVSAVMASAAWLEIHDGGSKEPELLRYKISENDVLRVKELAKNTKVKKALGTDHIKNLKGNRYTASIKDTTYRSILVVPLFVQDEHVGTLAVLKDLYDGFNKEMTEIIRTFTNQASISIENFKLIQEAIENERYKEELNIAKRVQGSLIPAVLHHNKDFEICAFTKSAAEVGGDYYDTYRLNDHEVAIIISDVSGKGTSAAFHMSQMKGVFHSLVQNCKSAEQFLIKANKAVSECLERTSFITATILILNDRIKEINFARAGHPPILYYAASSKKADYHAYQGMGLGMVRNDKYENYVHGEKLNYEPGDVLVLYTDGIIETRNSEGTEFGYDRLMNLVEQNAAENPKHIKDKVVEAMFDFCGEQAPDDDFTLLVIKFV